MIIKFIHHNGKKRQTKVEKTPSFEELRTLSQKIWGESVANCLFGYIDCDEELITIVNQDDWEVCVEEMESMQEDRKRVKLVVRILENDNEDLAESVVIKETPQLETEVSIAPTENVDVEVSRLEESAFNIVSQNVNEIEIEVEVDVEAEKPVEETPFDEKVEETVPVPTDIVQEALKRSLEAVELSKKPDQLDEWKMVSKSPSSVNSEIKSEVPVDETLPENGDENISEEQPENPVEEEESVFEENSNPVRVVNTNPEDCVIDIHVDGNDLEAVRQQVLELAPLMGFQVDKAEIVTQSKPEETPAPQPERTEIVENGLDLSTCETTRSSMTVDMRDEIQKMIQKRVKEELERSGLQTSRTTAPEPKVEEDKCETVHHGFSCDGCGINPIKGVRFHSLVQKNYDLCSKCEKKLHNEHPMIRFRKNTHRGLAHGRGWQTINKIITKAGQPQTHRGFGRCGRRRHPNHVTPANVIEFFTNGVFGGMNQVNQAGKTLGEHIKNAQKNVAKAAKKVEKEINKKSKCMKKRGLCHVRTRPQPTPAPVETPKVEETPAPQRHPRFEEFRKVFTNANHDELDGFLKQNDSVKDDNELYNKAITMFLA